MASEVSHTAKPSKHRVRAFFSALLIVLGCVLAPLTIAAVWVADVVGDTNRYVQTVSPLAANPDVQAAVTTRVTDAITERVDVQGAVTDAENALTQSLNAGPRLTQALGTLTAPLSSAIENFIQTVVQKFVQSPAFQKIWDAANRAAHSTLVATLSGKKGVVQSNGGNVSIDLGPVVAGVKQQLVANGLSVASKIPDVHTDFVVAQTDSLAKARKGYRLLEIIGNWLPFVVVLILAGGVLLARRRRRALVKAAVGVAFATLLLGIGTWIARNIYLDAIPATANKAAATALYDTIIRFLRVTIRTLGLLALVVAIAAFFSGPASFAVWCRGVVKGWLAGLRRFCARFGFSPDTFGRWVGQNRKWLTIGVVVVAAVGFALWNHPTVAVVFWFTLGVLFLLAVIEFLDPGLTPAAAGGPGKERPAVS